MSCCKRNNNMANPIAGDNTFCTNHPVVTLNEDCYKGSSFVDTAYELNRSNDCCRKHNHHNQSFSSSNRSFCEFNTDCCSKPEIPCEPIVLGCEDCTEYRLCTDPNGCAYKYPCHCRNPFWPPFSHPRWLCCSRLYNRTCKPNPCCCD